MVQTLLTIWRIDHSMLNAINVPVTGRMMRLACLAAGTLLAVNVVAQAPKPAAAKPAAATSSRIPRGPDGHPNLNGVWQVMNTANWDLSPHNAQQSLVLEAGAQLAEPAGIGVVEGGEIPYCLPRSPRRKRITPIARRPIRKCAAICRAYRAPLTCRFRSRFSRATSTWRSPMSTMARFAISI